MGRKKLNKEINIVRILRTLREHKLLIKALLLNIDQKDDYKQIRDKALYKQISLNDEVNTTENSITNKSSGSLSNLTKIREFMKRRNSIIPLDGMNFMHSSEGTSSRGRHSSLASSANLKNSERSQM